MEIRLHLDFCFICIKKLNDKLKRIFPFYLNCAGPEHFTPTVRANAFPEVYNQSGVTGAGRGSSGLGGCCCRPIIALRESRSKCKIS